ncbi:chromosomal replication initiator protein DnaA [Patescibacteria group bacterium]|nr:chromosomal replication initiator protein DnaA [Patescibacteria group bacterium]MBU1922107.1 chromosomal replication initiator protein DnaA [Patescibacteria group bacterium]
MDIFKIWQATLGELELNLSKANFTTWFRNTYIASLENDKVIVCVPNTFTKAWLEKKYNQAIIKSLRNIAGTPIKEIIYKVEVRPQSEVISELKIQTIEKKLDEGPRVPVIPQKDQWCEVGLNPKYTFKNFVVGKGNELANAAAQAVTVKPGEVYNPLFIYGGVGLGKTHLLQGIGHEVLARNTQARVLYVTCERFTNDFIHAVRGGRAKEFKDTYRGVDVLLVDDIQFLTGKEGTQEEFFHTFNALHQNNKQIILSSDRPPKAIPALEHRLMTRFEWGMMADISSPDFETRVAILENKCKEKKSELEREFLEHIAKTIQSNVRELEGALNKIIAYHQFKSILPTMETIDEILQSFSPVQKRKSIAPRQLIDVVAQYFDVKINELLGKSREKRLAFPRQIIMYLLREEMKTSYPAIGEVIGGRDHTTAMHAFEKISRLSKEDEQLKHDLELILDKLYNA